MEQYNAVKLVQSEFPPETKVNAKDIVRAMELAGSRVEVALWSIDDWLHGSAPRSVLRMRKLEVTAAELLSPEVRHEIGKKIKERVAVGGFSQERMVPALVDWFGGSNRLAQASGVNKDQIDDLIAGKDVLSPSDYAKVLGGMGLKEQPPPTSKQLTPRLVERAISDPADRLIFRDFEAVVMRDLREAKASGRNLREALEQSLARVKGHKWHRPRSYGGE